MTDAARENIGLIAEMGRERNGTSAETPGTMLLAIQDPVVAGSCQLMLESAGWTVRKSSDPASLLIQLESPFDVLLLDHRVAAQLEPDDLASLHHDRIDGGSAICLIASSDEVGASPTHDQLVPDEIILRPIRPAELQARVRSLVQLTRHRREQQSMRALRGEQARMWNVLLDFSRFATRILDFDQVLDAIVESAAQMTCSQRISLMLPDNDDDGYLSIARSRGIPDAIRARTRVPIGTAIAGRAFASGQRITAVQDDRAPAHDHHYQGQSFVSLPIETASLTGPPHRVGVLNITHRFNDRPFDAWELEFIDILGKIAGAAIDDMMWIKARESMLKVERDLQLAREIQERTFPTSTPDLEGFEVAAWTQPAEQTGGDTYDMIGVRSNEDGSIVIDDANPERSILLVADATGHGVGPALSVTQLRSMLRMGVRMSGGLPELTRHMNEQLHFDLPHGRFICAWLAELIPSESSVRFISAGLGTVLHFKAAEDHVEMLGADTIPLGIDPALPPIEPVTLRLRAGDMLLVISDGIMDATDGIGEPFGLDRVKALLRDGRGLHVEDIISRLREAMTRYISAPHPDDDCTAMLIAKR